MDRASQIEAFKLRKAINPTSTNGRVVDRHPLPLRLMTSDCQYLGEKLPGQPCGKPLFKCDKFQEITTRWIKCDKATRHCATCDVPDEEKFNRVGVTATLSAIPSLPQGRVSYDKIEKRHLIYHILPASGNGVWRKGVDHLRLRWNLFTGKKIISVATGGAVHERVDGKEHVSKLIRKLPLDSIHTVKNYLPSDCEVIEVQNDPHLWELSSWPLLWKSVLDSANDNDAILYAHAKGVTRKLTSPCHAWSDMLYSLSLDHWGLVERLLMSKPVAGSLIKKGHYFGGILSHSNWHYSGNFWWSRAGVIRERLERYPMPLDRWGSEAWIGIGFHLSEAGNIFSPSFPMIHLYSPRELERVVGEYDRWLTHNKPTMVSESESIQQSL